MASSTARIRERAPMAMAGGYLGPAEVVRAEGHEVDVRIPASGAGSPEIVRAELALAFPYAPAVGDTLLVIGKEGAHYVIGVLRGAGQSRFSLPGDVGLHAGGSLHLSADKEISLRSPELEVQADKLRMIAGAVLQTFTTAFKRVKELYSVHAGESHTLVEGASYSQSKSAAILTQETVTINGNEVHLG